MAELVAVVIIIVALVGIMPMITEYTTEEYDFSVSVNGTESAYDDIDSAIAAINDASGDIVFKISNRKCQPSESITISEGSSLTVKSSGSCDLSLLSSSFFDNYGTLTIESGTFCNYGESGNSASSNGGIIYNYSGTVTISGGTFSGNSASSGGVVYNRDTCIVSGGIFSNNSATYGGVVCSNGGKIIISGGTFSGNSASTGGVVYSKSESFCEITEGNFVGNSASGSGGVAYINSSSTCTISGGTFSVNSAASNGGVVCDYNSSSCTISGGTFVGNSAKSSGDFLRSDDTSTYTISPEVSICSDSEDIIYGREGTNSATIITEWTKIRQITSDSAFTVDAGRSIVIDFSTIPDDAILRAVAISIDSGAELASFSESVTDEGGSLTVNALSPGTITITVYPVAMSDSILWDNLTLTIEVTGEEPAPIVNSQSGTDKITKEIVSILPIFIILTVLMVVARLLIKFLRVLEKTRT